MRCDGCNNKLDERTINNVSTFNFSDGSREIGYSFCVICGGKIKRLIDGGKL